MGRKGYLCVSKHDGSRPPVGRAEFPDPAPPAVESELFFDPDTGCLAARPMPPDRAERHRAREHQARQHRKHRVLGQYHRQVAGAGADPHAPGPRGQFLRLKTTPRPSRR
jgi:hypothetical protein